MSWTAVRQYFADSIVRQLSTIAPEYLKASEYNLHAWLIRDTTVAMPLSARTSIRTIVHTSHPSQPDACTSACKKIGNSFALSFPAREEGGRLASIGVWAPATEGWAGEARGGDSSQAQGRC